jgi:NADPH:quinone reductase-like Zn-dependent oxidoreductase
MELVMNTVPLTPKNMKAIVRKQFGGTDTLHIKSVPVPTPAQGEVLIRIKAFGINRAEIYMREGAWGDVADISGIECVGIVEHDPSGTLESGQPVFAVMGGMGRTRAGSYAEFTVIPKENVIPFQSTLPWAHLAAIPESYATAWSALYGNMHLRTGDKVLIRGGTSALGQAAINIASAQENTYVIATTRNPDRVQSLKDLGCNQVLIDAPDLSKTVREQMPHGLNSVLDIVGNTTLIDSLNMVKTGGTVCNAGFLGGGESFMFNPLMDMPPAVNLNFFASFMFGTPDFPLSHIPMDDIVRCAENGTFNAAPAHTLGFEDIAKAHTLMESGQALGKIVVTV